MKEVFKKAISDFAKGAKEGIKESFHITENTVEQATNKEELSDEEKTYQEENIQYYDPQKKEKSIFKKCNLCNKRNVILNQYGICQTCEIQQLRKAVLPEYNNFEYLKDKIDKINQEIIEKQDKLKALNQEINIKENEIFTLDDTILLQNFGLFEPTYDFALSVEYKEELNNIRNKQKEMVRNKTAVEYYDGWTVNGSKAEGRKMTNSNIKQILRTFNNECDTLIDKAKFNNIDKIKQRIEKSYEQLNKMNESIQIKLKPAYLKLKFDELTLAYEYQVKKQQEKEEERERREALREQQKLEKEIKEARNKILKEKKHFNNAIKEAKEQLKNTLNEDEKINLLNKIKELEQQLKNIDSEEKVIDYREKNAKAGYVYIISNIGAFGENVYKIGMTRRLDPMDRIRELGDASVPFSFDVHALIFSEDAPKLESKLHEHFFNDRINKLNNRKEFYKTNLEEIEKVVKENYDKTVEFKEIPEAEQYRQSILI